MRWIGIAVLGIGGVAILVALGVWQLARLDEKNAYIARIETALAAPAVPLPDDPAPEDEFRAVEVTGIVGPGILRFVHSANAYGYVVPLETSDGAILADLGLVPANTIPDLEGQRLTLTGNLADPQGRDTVLRIDQPNAWTQRDTASMADALGTKAVMVVARDVEPALDQIRPFPITTDGIPNNHLGYAIQWFGIAAAWAAMAALLGWRMSRPSV